MHWLRCMSPVAAAGVAAGSVDEPLWEATTCQPVLKRIHWLSSAHSCFELAGLGSSLPQLDAGSLYALFGEAIMIQAPA